MNIQACVLCLLFIFSGNPVMRVARINKAIFEASNAYHKKDYTTAIKQYGYLADSLKISDIEVRLNMANSYFNADEAENAYKSYELCTTSPDKHKKAVSKAFSQLGSLSYQQEDIEKALEQYKKALKNDPYNEIARYNYELLKKKQNQQQSDSEKQNQENKDQQEKDKSEKNDSEQNDQKNQEQKNKQSESEGNKEDEQKNKIGKTQQIDELNMSEEKAKMLLEAMKESEAQYIQNQKKPKKVRVEDGKPDW